MLRSQGILIKKFKAKFLKFLCNREMVYHGNAPQAIMQAQPQLTEPRPVHHFPSDHSTLPSPRQIELPLLFRRISPCHSLQFSHTAMSLSVVHPPQELTDACTLE